MWKRTTAKIFLWIVRWGKRIGTKLSIRKILALFMALSLKMRIAVIAILCMGIVIGGAAGQIHKIGWVEAFEGAGVSLNPLVLLWNAITTFVGWECIFIAIIVVIAVVLWDMFSEDRNGKKDARGFEYADNPLYGSARWMTESQLKKVLTLTPPRYAEGLIFGERGGNVVSMPLATPFNRHVLCIGASGSGKSRTIIRNGILQSIKNQESCVITDPSGELYRDTAEYARRSGYTIKVFNLIDPQHGNRWNLLKRMPAGDIDGAQMLASVIVTNTLGARQEKDFWARAEENLLNAMILYALSFPNGAEERSIPGVYQLLVSNTLERLASIMSRLPIDHPARPSWAIFRESNETVQKQVKTGLSERLQILQNKGIRALMGEGLEDENIDLEDLGRKKMMCYVIIPVFDSTKMFISSMFFSFLIRDLTQQGELQVPVNLLMDEFVNLGTLGISADGSDFVKALNNVRKYGIRMLMVTQSLPDLQSRYRGNLYDAIIGACDFQLMLGCNDLETAEYWSKLSGETTIEYTTTAREHNDWSLNPLDGMMHHKESEGKGKRAVLTPHEVLTLSREFGEEELLLRVTGNNLLKLHRFDFSKHPDAKELVKSDINRYDPLHPEEAATDEYVLPRGKSAPGRAVDAPESQEGIEKEVADLYEEVREARANHAPIEAPLEMEVDKELVVPNWMRDPYHAKSFQPASEALQERNRPIQKFSEPEKTMENTNFAENSNKVTRGYQFGLDDTEERRKMIEEVSRRRQKAVSWKTDPFTKPSETRKVEQEALQEQKERAGLLMGSEMERAQSLSKAAKMMEKASSSMIASEPVLEVSKELEGVPDAPKAPEKVMEVRKPKDMRESEKAKKKNPPMQERAPKPKTSEKKEDAPQGGGWIDWD